MEKIVTAGHVTTRNQVDLVLNKARLQWLKDYVDVSRVNRVFAYEPVLRLMQHLQLFYSTDSNKISQERQSIHHTERILPGH